MKKPALLLTLFLLCAPTLSLRAQSGLHAEQIFRQFGTQKGCKMTVLHDATLNGLQVKVYKSFVYKTHATAIRTLLQADRKQAETVREAVAKDGQVFGCYQMKSPTTDNRFIIFRHQSPTSGIIIYLEAPLSADEILRFSRK